MRTFVGNRSATGRKPAKPVGSGSAASQTQINITTPSLSPNWCKGGAGTWRLMNGSSITITTIANNQSGQTISVTGLSCGTTYTYILRLECSNGINSDDSNSFNVATNACSGGSGCGACGGDFGGLYCSGPGGFCIF